MGMSRSNRCPNTLFVTEPCLRITIKSVKIKITMSINKTLNVKDVKFPLHIQQPEVNILSSFSIHSMQD